MKYLVVLISLVLMNYGYAQSYDDYLDDVNEYESCFIVSEVFSGGPICEEPDDYEPCNTAFSGGPNCTPPDDSAPCAVYIEESGNLHLNDVYVEGTTTIDYVKMINKDGTFHIEEISP